MATFKKLNTRVYAKTGPEVTPDTEYWKKLSVPVLVKEFGPVDYIDFSPVEPYYFAVSCSVRVQIYNPITKLVEKNLSKFRESAYGASFRSDGRLICAGEEEGSVKLFDVNTKSLLRVFKGHSAPVHRTFFTGDKLHIASFSDDKSVKLWDVATEQCTLSFAGNHSDYIRAGAVSPAAPDILLSGAYDHTAKLYDTRTNSVVLSVDHGSPIESALFLPSGGMFLTAGGTEIRVWDAFTRGKLLTTLSAHHKTVTCLSFAGSSRLMSGSLDRHVKIYDVSSFKVVHTLDFPNAVLSLAAAVDASTGDKTIVAGMVDGLVSIQRHEKIHSAAAAAKRKNRVSFRYIAAKQLDEVVSEEYFDKGAKYNRHFQRFEFQRALTSVLMPYIMNKNPANVVAVLQELLKRTALERAVKNLDSSHLVHLLRFLTRYISDYRFTRVLIQVTNLLVDVYEDSVHLQPPEVTKIFLKLEKKLADEQELGEHLANLQGALQLLLAGATLGQEQPQNVVANHNLLPSEIAQENLVFNVT